MMKSNKLIIRHAACWPIIHISPTNQFLLPKMTGIRVVPVPTGLELNQTYRCCLNSDISLEDLFVHRQRIREPSRSALWTSRRCTLRSPAAATIVGQKGSAFAKKAWIFTRKTDQTDLSPKAAPVIDRSFNIRCDDGTLSLPHY